MADQRFPKRVRILRAQDFERVFAVRTTVSDAWLVLYGVANDASFARIGLVVSRRVGNAVARNRWKRLLREAFRMEQHELPAIDLVCVVRGPEPPTLDQLRMSLRELVARLEPKLKRNRDTRPTRDAK